MTNGILRFNTNSPVEVALRWDDGKRVEGRYGEQVLYTLEGGLLVGHFFLRSFPAKACLTLLTVPIAGIHQRRAHRDHLVPGYSCKR